MTERCFSAFIKLPPALRLTFKYIINLIPIYEYGIIKKAYRALVD